MASATAAPSVEPEPSSSSTDEAGGGANQQPTGASDPSSSTPSMPSAGPEPASGEAKPSAGCGKSGKPSGGEVMTSEGHIYRFPDGYDGSKPFPLLIGFHACGNANTEFLNLTQGSKFETDYVRAFPRSSDASGMCWSYDADIDTRVLAAFDDLLATYCIDENRIFATGHSSGAQMIVQILTHKDAAEHLGFKAVAPVAASDYGSLSLPVPVMYIQGKNDSVRGEDGASTVARFATANGCSSGSDPYADVMGCQSSGTSVDPGCVEYQDCSVPTIWCSHNDPQYNGTSHGVPCFAIGAMYDFFSTLP